jgi:hypothetical protein
MFKRDERAQVQKERLQLLTAVPFELLSFNNQKVHEWLRGSKQRLPLKKG